jgi:hypothetical protein
MHRDKQVARERDGQTFNVDRVQTMTNAQRLDDCLLFFQTKDGHVNSERHPETAAKKGRWLIAEARRLRRALERVHALSFEKEETAATWKDVAIEQGDIAKSALDSEGTVYEGRAAAGLPQDGGGR